jgi:hypothetical protein
MATFFKNLNRKKRGILVNYQTVLNALNKKKAGKKERVDNGCPFMEVQSRTVEKVIFEQRPQTRQVGFCKFDWGIFVCQEVLTWKHPRERDCFRSLNLKQKPRC